MTGDQVQWNLDDMIEGVCIPSVLKLDYAVQLSPWPSSFFLNARAAGLFVTSLICKYCMDGWMDG
jgi:hypothetical protein